MKNSWKASALALCLGALALQLGCQEPNAEAPAAQQAVVSGPSAFDAAYYYAPGNRITMIDGLRAWVFDGNANSWSTLDLGEAWSDLNAPFEDGQDERIDAAYYHPATDRLTVVRGTNAYVQSVASGTWKVEDLRVTWADGPFANGVTTPIDDAYFYAGHNTVTVTRDSTAWVYSFDTHVWTTVDLEKAWAGPNNPFETTYRIDSAFAGPGNRLTVTRGRTGFSFNFDTATWDPPFKLSQVMTGAGSPPYPQMLGPEAYYCCKSFDPKTKTGKQCTPAPELATAFGVRFLCWTVDKLFVECGDGFVDHNQNLTCL